PVLEVSQVAYAYRGIEAVRDVSLKVAGGEAVGVVGPNGAGKTTLAKMIAGILNPARGTVEVAGKKVSGMRPHQVPVHGIGIVLEGRHVFAGQTCTTNLELGAFWRKLKRAQLDEEFQRVYDLFPDLEKHRNKRAGDLSGGQQQMLAVARALMGS